MTTNAFKINGVALSHQPSDHNWKDRDILGVDGNGHAIYPSPREYELTWDFLSSTEFQEIYAYYQAIGHTGTAVVELPQWANATYQFFAYSGCVLREPTFGKYFENYYSDVKLLIVKIAT